MNAPTYRDLDSFTQAYVEMAIWIADPAPSPGSFEVNPDDFDAMAPEDRVRIASDCVEFQRRAGALLTAVADMRPDFDAYHAGHNFYLSRHGHGSGFWDRNLGEVGDELHALAQSFGEAVVWAIPNDEDGSPTYTL